MAVSVVAIELEGVLADWPASDATWPSPEDIARLLERVGVTASPVEFRAALDYVLRWDAPRWRLATQAETASQLAFRIGAEQSRRCVSMLAHLLAARRPPEAREGAAEATSAAKAHGWRVCAITALPPFWSSRALARLRPAISRVHSAVTEGVPWGTRAFYERLAERANCRTSELAVIGPDPIAHVAAARAAGANAVLLAEADAPGRRGREIATCSSLEGAVAAVAAWSATRRRKR